MRQAFAYVLLITSFGLSASFLHHTDAETMQKVLGRYEDGRKHLRESCCGVMNGSVLMLIDSLVSNLAVDRRKVYVVGFSMGGSTAINALVARPDLFSAGISISGIPQFEKIQELSTIPIWLIHGIDDRENPIDNDEKFFMELKSRKVRFWKMKNTGHNDVLEMGLVDRILLEWLLRQSK